MKPYYEHAGITIYHGDCREILPQVGRADLLLTDPPYGIGRSGQVERFTSDSKHKRKYHGDFGWDSERPCEQTFAAMLESSDKHAIWGGNYFADMLPASMGWLYWDKGQNGLSMSDGELAWTSMQRALRAFTCNRSALVGSQHPTQKPLALMKWCVSLFPGVRSVLDPFCGSGTTLVAAKDLGLTAIGIEREEKYCEIAAQRLSQEVMSFA